MKAFSFRIAVIFVVVQSLSARRNTQSNVQWHEKLVEVNGKKLLDLHMAQSEMENRSEVASDGACRRRSCKRRNGKGMTTSRSSRIEPKRHRQDYDCDGRVSEDGVLHDECGKWDYGRLRCGNGEKCEYKFKFGDLTLGHSCRCKRELSHYDCDGDGDSECGTWEYGKAKCANLDKCEYRYQFGDFRLGQGCRCRRQCYAYYPGTAAADRTLTSKKPNIGQWTNWVGNIDTCAPWQTPANDHEVQKILNYARTKGYKVRPSGASHSASPLVTDAINKNIVVLSLANYAGATGPTTWEEGKIFFADDGTPRIRSNAGWTLRDLYEKIRPDGYHLPTHTSGSFFQLAGVVAGPVHGGTYQSSFLHSYVTGLRVMAFDGTISILDDEKDLRYWRNSYGLLGVILGIEFRLVHHEKFQLYTKRRKLDGWDEENFWSFIKGDGEANVPAGSVSVGVEGSRKALAGQFFFNLLADEPEALVVAEKADNHADEVDVPVATPSGVRANYLVLKNKPVKTSRGTETWNQAVRRDGAPAHDVNMDWVMDIINSVLNGNLNKGIARWISTYAFSAISDLVGKARESFNDGFFLDSTPTNVLYCAYLLEPSKAFEAFDHLRKVMRARNAKYDGVLEFVPEDHFTWNQPAEFRFINVTDDAVLHAVPPGFYFASEVLSFPGGKSPSVWSKGFKEVEDYWINNLGAKPHTSKLFGFGTKAGSEVVEPFVPSETCKVYSEAQKQEFDKYRKKWDPEGLFAYGLGMDMLKACP